MPSFLDRSFLSTPSIHFYILYLCSTNDKGYSSTYTSTAGSFTWGHTETDMKLHIESQANAQKKMPYRVIMCLLNPPALKWSQVCQV